MNSDQLIQSVIEDEERKRINRNRFWVAIREQATRQFAENCRTWLGDFLGEILPAGQDVLQFVSFDIGEDDISYHMHVTGQWRGAEVTVHSGWSRLRYSNNDSPSLRFSVLHGRGVHGDSWSDSEVLPFHAVPAKDCEYNRVAEPLNPLALGAMLIKANLALETAAHYAIEKKEEKRRIAIEKKEEKRRIAIEGHLHKIRRCSTPETFDIIGPEDFERIIESAAAEFPDLEETWCNERRKVLETLKAAEAKAKEDNERRERRLLEIARLEAEALKLFRPFVVYCVTYGANSEDGDDWYTQEAYTTQPEPNADGWWSVLGSYGKIRQMRIINIISIEKIAIHSSSEVPLAICARNTLKSDVDVAADWRVEYLYMPEESGVEFLDGGEQ